MASSSATGDLEVTQVAPGTYAAWTPLVSWTLLLEGSDVTLVDAGYPRDAAKVAASLAAVGCRPEQVVAVLVTHGHVDHIGGIPALLRRVPGARVLTSAPEVGNVRRDRIEQATAPQLLGALRRPGVLSWSLRIIGRGALSRAGVAAVEPVAAGAVLDLPGRPVAVEVPGHTTGHTCYHLPDVGALVTGDALVTAHPTSPRQGPQLLPSVFHHDPARAVETLDLLEGVDADVLLPGHGAAHSGSVREAVQRAHASGLPW